MGKIGGKLGKIARRPDKMSLTKCHLPKCQRQNVSVEKSARFFFDIYNEKSGAIFDGFYLAILKKTWGMRDF